MKSGSFVKRRKMRAPQLTKQQRCVVLPKDNSPKPLKHCRQSVKLNSQRRKNWMPTLAERPLITSLTWRIVYEVSILLVFFLSSLNIQLTTYWTSHFILPTFLFCECHNIEIKSRLRHSAVRTLH